MRKLSIALLLLPGALLAQNASNPLITGSKMMYQMTINNVIKSAEEMPEDQYSFKPTPEVRSFGQLIGHVADAQYEFCGPVIADGTKSPDVEKTVTSKAQLISALKQAEAYCMKAYSTMSDADAVQTAKFFGRPLPKLTILDFNTAHTDEHYGNIVTYLRMKGLTPPSSQH